MTLRRLPPSSEKMSHRRHKRNEAKYTPIRSACKVVAMIYALMTESIISMISTSNSIYTAVTGRVVGANGPKI